MRGILAGLALLSAGLGLASPAFAQSETAVAVAGPMTGKEATFGAQFLAGASAAVADINAKGGVLGKPLKLITGDDQCDPKPNRSSNHFCDAKGSESSDHVEGAMGNIWDSKHTQHET